MRACWLALVGAMAVAAPAGADSDVEPNDACASAQNVAGTTVTGQLTTGDVDFFRFALVPGKAYVVTMLGRSAPGVTLRQALVGEFSDCELVDHDHAGYRRDARIGLVGPEDGEVVVGAAVGRNHGFAAGVTESTGTYRLEILEGHPFSVKARIVDYWSGAPLESIYTTLTRCNTPYCENSEAMESVASGADGQVAYATDDGLTGDRMRLSVATSSQYQAVTPYTFVTLVPGQHIYDLGTLAVEPPPLAFVSRQGCNFVLAGDMCVLQYRVENRSGRNIAIRAWGILENAGRQFGTEPGDAEPVVRTLQPGITQLSFDVRLPPQGTLDRRYDTFQLKVWVTPAEDPANPYLESHFEGQVTRGAQ